MALLLALALALVAAAQAQNKITDASAYTACAQATSTPCRALRIQGNMRTGSLPSELGLLTALTVLSLNGNSLSHAVPTELGALTSLVQLELNNNKLTGALPSELAALTGLTQLFIGSNKLSGAVPSQLAALTNLIRLTRSARRSPPPPSPSPPPAAKIEQGRAYVKVLAQAVVSGTLNEWQSQATRAAFEGACAESFGAQCAIDGVKAGSTVVDFTLVQYRDTDTGTFLGDRFADPIITAAFRAAVLAATGSTVESSPTVVSVTKVSASGVVIYYAAFSGGATAGLVIMCVVVAALIVGGVYAYRTHRRRRYSVDGTAK